MLLIKSAPTRRALLRDAIAGAGERRTGEGRRADAFERNQGARVYARACDARSNACLSPQCRFVQSSQRMDQPEHAPMTAAEEASALVAAELENALAKAAAAAAEAEQIRSYLAAAQDRAEAERLLASTCLSPLPAIAVEAIFLALPIPSRLRCREVSRSWRAFLEDRGMWASIDIGSLKDASPALLAAAVARSGGRVRELRVSMSGWRAGHGPMPYDVILEAVRENGATLTELSVGSVNHSLGFPFSSGYLTKKCIIDLHLAAPHLHSFECLLLSGFEDVAEVLSTTDELGQQLIQLHGLHVQTLDFEPESAEHTQMMLEEITTTLMRDHHSLKELLWGSSTSLNVRSPDEPTRGLDCVVDAAIACKVSRFHLDVRDMTPAHLFALKRLLIEGSLTHIKLEGVGMLFCGVGALSQFCSALRGSKIEELHLRGEDIHENNDLWSGLWELEGLGQVFASLKGHRTLRVLNLDGNLRPLSLEARVAACEMLGSLVDENGTLCELFLSRCGFGETVRPLFDAVARSRTLRKLDLAYDYYPYNNWEGPQQMVISPSFARNIILPAVRANASLRELTFYNEKSGTLIPGRDDVEGVPGTIGVLDLARAEAEVDARSRWPPAA